MSSAGEGTVMRWGIGKQLLERGAAVVEAAKMVLPQRVSITHRGR